MKFVIHVGLPKTGTTFLQRNVFPNMQEINFICKYNTTQNMMLTARLSEDKINLISDETLYGQIYNVKNQKGTLEMIDWVHKLFPDARIIVCFRDKTDWLKSLYLHWMRQPERFQAVKDFKDFVTHQINPLSLDFESYENKLREKFKDVLVLQFEDLKKDHKKFVTSICKYLDTYVPQYSNERINMSIRNVRVYNLMSKVNDLPASYYTLPVVRMLLGKVNKK